MKALIFCFFINLLLLFTACHHNNANKDFIFISLGEEGMIPDKQYVFQPFDSLKNLDKNEIYDINLVIRFSESCHINQLHLGYEYSSPECDSIFNDKVTVPLFNDKDGFIGKGNFTIYQTQIPLLRKIPFQEGFFIAFQSLTKNTKGILDIGINLNK